MGFSSGQRDVDVLLVRGARAKPFEPRIEVRIGGAFDRQAHPQLDVATERNVPHAELAPAEVLASSEHRVWDGEKLSGLLPPLLDRLRVALLRRRSHQP